MAREQFSLPIIEEKEIDPEKNVSQEVKNTRRERHERETGLSQYILRWWRGDAHTHSRESTREGFGYAEGVYDIEEMRAYYKKLGLEFVCVTEHASKPGAPSAQSPESPIAQSLLRGAERITELNRAKEDEDFSAFSGVEASIFFNEEGNAVLDVPQEVLQKLDIVIASRHAIAREKEPDAIRESLIWAIRNPSVDVIGHPDRYAKRDGDTSQEYMALYWSTWQDVIDEMARHHKAFEINMNNPPDKKLVEMAARAGVKFFLNFDAHDFGQYKREQTPVTRAGEQAKGQWANSELTEEDAHALKTYKEERLSHGPGYATIRRLVLWIKELEKLGVTPERVVNSSRENLLNFLRDNRGKHTENLDQLSAAQ